MLDVQALIVECYAAEKKNEVFFSRNKNNTVTFCIVAIKYFKRLFFFCIFGDLQSMMFKKKAVSVVYSRLSIMYLCICLYCDLNNRINDKINKMVANRRKEKKQIGEDEDRN